MASIYDEYARLAEHPEPLSPASETDVSFLEGVLSPVLGLLAELRKKGIVNSAESRRQLTTGVEYRWPLAGSRTLVVQALVPVTKIDQWTCDQARIVAGIADEADRFLEMPGCGWYPKIDGEPNEANMEKHWLILRAIADLVRRYRT